MYPSFCSNCKAGTWLIWSSLKLGVSIGDSLKHDKCHVICVFLMRIFALFFTIGRESTKVSNAEPANQRFFYVQSGPSKNNFKLSPSFIS